MYRYLTTSTWTAVGHFSRALSKGAIITSWIWNLHINSHEYESNTTSFSLYLRKVFSSNMSHGTLVLTWLSSMHFHGAYFSNYSIWIKSPAVILPSSQSTWNPAGQDILNLDAGAYDSSTMSIAHITGGDFGSTLGDHQDWFITFSSNS